MFCLNLDPLTLCLDTYGFMGHAPILSTTGARYFLLLIDDFSWFSWLHPLHDKDQALPTFIKFKALVENQFNSPSLCLLYDNSGENIYI